MGEMTRKDYGTDAIVDQSSETMKRVNSMNAPYSVEATGHDHRKENLIEMNEANVEALTTGTRALVGNKEGVVKSITMSDDEVPVYEGVVVTFKATTGTEGVQDTYDVAYTKAQLLSHEVLFFVEP